MLSWSAAPCWSSTWLDGGLCPPSEHGGTDGFLPVPSFQTQLADKPVQDRGLVVTNPRAEDVVLEHRSYCAAKARERHVAGDVLGYVTPVSWVHRVAPGQGGSWGLRSHGGVGGQQDKRLLGQQREQPQVLWGLVCTVQMGLRCRVQRRLLGPLQPQVGSAILRLPSVEQPWL